MSHLGKCLVEYRCEVNRQLYQSTRKVSELSRQNQELTHKNQELTRQNNELIRRQNESTGPTLKSTDESIIRTKRLVTQTLEHYQLVYCYPTSGKKGTSGFSDILGDKDLEELVEKREEKKKQLLEILGEWVRVQKKWSEGWIVRKGRKGILEHEPNTS